MGKTAPNAAGLEISIEAWAIMPGLDAAYDAERHYSLVGTVERTGDALGRFAPGDLVVVEGERWCGGCMACRRGFFSQCLRKTPWQTPSPAGAMVVEEKYCHAVTAFVDAYESRGKAIAAGTLVQLFARVFNAMFTHAHGFTPGAYVAVAGSGPVARAAALLAKAAGAARVLPFDADAILGATDGVGIHIGIACGDPEKHLPEMERAMAVGGKLVQIGGSTHASDFLGQHYQKKGASFHAASGSAGHGNWEAVIRMAAEGLLDPLQIPIEVKASGVFDMAALASAAHGDRVGIMVLEKTA